MRPNARWSVGVVLGAALASGSRAWAINNLAQAPSRAIWTEPALFVDKGVLFMASLCMNGTTDVTRTVNHLFRHDGDGLSPAEWRWLGPLTSKEDAQAFGAHTLEQADLVYGRDGQILYLVTPIEYGTLVKHFGCRVLEVESLEPPRLRRGADGRPVVRATITSSDTSPDGSGLCAYDPDSATGVLLVRREGDGVTETMWRLHATGVRP